ncbi:Fur family transcriptional regulator [Histidinibacterium lentulum]|uniref:Transcriptional repressor n=1 Tax=Histidinibacterium lentulum TaxID=2480588 RepID=A0A3N2R747_9RHOB|nr:Fur family transcriptional regulator [Histidinibacterium lentulum]ROU03300.1 transcriptional repressor [Histidinibacterium lentulum]
MDAIGFQRHDHQSCISGAVAAADARCAEAGLNLTPVRRRVLEILLERHRALGAYEVLEVLRQEGLGAQPPVAYRALEFLTTNGFAHRIERLSAFVACAHPHEDHVPAFLICRSCDRVAEATADPMKGLLGEAARATGFTVERAVVEAEGLCPSCLAAGGSPGAAPA